MTGPGRDSLVDAALRMVHHPLCDKPDPMLLCKCGANVTCRTCHWGKGALPCKCKPAPTYQVIA